MELLYGGILLAISIKASALESPALNSGLVALVGMPDLLRVFAATSAAGGSCCGRFYRFLDGRFRFPLRYRSDRFASC